MRTRSQTKAIKTIENINYEVNIDFDEASRMWNSNKKKLKNCCYEYVCGKELQSGCFCKKKIYKSEFCRIHQN
jgi:hypothetical protein